MCGKKNERVLPLECELLFSGFIQLQCTWFILLRIVNPQRGFSYGPLCPSAYQSSNVCNQNNRNINC